ncbi:MAG: hypothetical protein IKS48_02305 [Eubacterium sp.]|nr:hypothetical protein [Eubacterium sp.]
MKSFSRNMTARFISIMLAVFFVMSGLPAEIKGGSVEAANTSLSVKVTVMYDYAYQVLDLINAERSKEGLSPLKMDTVLLGGAIQRATESLVVGEAYAYSEIDGSVAHTRPDGSSWYTVNDKIMAENIAYGQRTPDKVVEAWMGSTGHRANILDSSYKSIGIGVVYVNSTYCYYWAQAFSTQEASVPAVRSDSVKKTYTVKASATVYNRLSNNGKLGGIISKKTVEKTKKSKGWTKVGSKWKYKRNGKFLKNAWLKEGGEYYRFGPKGFMCTGWKTIKGKKYYFYKDGKRAHNEWIKGKWLGAKGVWKYKPKGSWHQNSTGRWYGDTSGWYAKNCWQKINGKKYYFDAAGYLVRNAYIDGCYVGPDGAMQ